MLISGFLNDCFEFKHISPKSILDSYLFPIPKKGDLTRAENSPDLRHHMHSTSPEYSCQAEDSRVDRISSISLSRGVCETFELLPQLTSFILDSIQEAHTSSSWTFHTPFTQSIDLFFAQESVRISETQKYFECIAHLLRSKLHRSSSEMKLLGQLFILRGV